jgi:hypothetical protein
MVETLPGDSDLFGDITHVELFQRRDIEQYTDSLADYIPGGCMFAAAHIQDTNFRRLLTGLSFELFNANGLLRAYSNGILPDCTVEFIEEWESMLGIPDECFPATGDINERRLHIIIKLARMNVTTLQDLQNLLDLLNINVTLSCGIDHITFPLTFPILFFNTRKDARFTIVATLNDPDCPVFPLTFPIPFGCNVDDLLRCVLNELRPANTKVLFIEELNPGDGGGDGGGSDR